MGFLVCPECLANFIIRVCFEKSMHFIVCCSLVVVDSFIFPRSPRYCACFIKLVFRYHGYSKLANVVAKVRLLFMTARGYMLYIL